MSNQNRNNNRQQSQQADKPKDDASKADATKTDAAKADASKTDAAKTEGQKADDAKAVDADVKTKEDEAKAKEVAEREAVLKNANPQGDLVDGKMVGGGDKAELSPGAAAGAPQVDTSTNVTHVGAGSPVPSTLTEVNAAVGLGDGGSVSTIDKRLGHGDPGAAVDGDPENQNEDFIDPDDQEAKEQAAANARAADPLSNLAPGEEFTLDRPLTAGASG